MGYRDSVNWRTGVVRVPKTRHAKTPKPLSGLELQEERQLVSMRPLRCLLHGGPVPTSEDTGVWLWNTQTRLDQANATV
jgi:hypothetical protein